MEQAPSAVNWRPRNAAKPPNVMRLWSWQAVAHGADAVMFFQWRQSRGGAERYHSAMVPHAGPDTRVFREARELGGELAAQATLAGTRQARAEVAVVIDWPSWWALELDAHPSSDVALLECVMSHYVPLHARSVACDVVAPSADLSGYRLVVVPNLYLVDQADAERMERYVHDGGTLLMSFFSGIVDPCDRVHLGGYPAPFRRVLGVWVEEFRPLAEGASVGLVFEGEAARLGPGTGGVWSELIRCEGADAVARFADGQLDRNPAVTRHRFGAGTAWYLATRPDPQTMLGLLDAVCAQAGVEPPLRDLPDGVQARVRDTVDGTAVHMLLNHAAAPATVRLPAPMRDELSGVGAAETIRLAPHGVALLRPAGKR